MKRIKTCIVLLVLFVSPTLPQQGLMLNISQNNVTIVL